MGTFDIFSGHVDKESKWIESVGGLGKAAMRIGLLAAEKPGAYFVYDPATHSIVMSVDTSKDQQGRSAETSLR
jgi:hypothetical protein